MATWGHTVLAAPPSNALSYQSGPPVDIHSAFVAKGKLNNTSNAYTSGQLVALAQPLTVARPVVFGIGLQQDRTNQFLTDAQAGYYSATARSLSAATSYFMSDYNAAVTESQAFDQKIVQIGKQTSQDYVDILEAHVRQIFGGFQVTIPDKSLNTSEAMAFMKEISTDGNVNTVADLLPRAFPFFYMLAPEYMRLFLDPVLQFSKAHWQADFAIHDIGKHYPNATGETVQSEEPLLLDQTSVLLWMVYAYQKKSGNTDWVKPYLPMLQKNADYLVKNGLFPPKQRSAVDSIEATANQTVLAIYSVLGMESFAKLSGKDKYSVTAKDYASKILKMSLDSKKTHIKAHYGDDDSSWISTYPFAFEKLLGLNLFGQSVYDMQSKWYDSQKHPNGIQFYHGVDKTVSTLEMWLAGTSSAEVRDYIIASIHKTMTNGLNTVPGPTIWNVVGENIGKAYMTKAKSDVASYFMVAAVNE